ncbi:FprA family A-type flavoprotein [Candidatus Bathyarchaeota archaeon]|nr:FprA family A-type flavoprotein [Candidatus Bathyarchaeota archaeon]
MFYTPEVSDRVYFVGVKDHNRRIFDALIPLPKGTSYNSYLVKGKRNALIDTVNPGFEEELVGRIKEVIEVGELNYVVMNHAEPDHAGAIPYIMKLCDASLIATEKGAEMAMHYYNVPEERVMKVKDGDRLDLGGKTLRFLEAPWLHWPETMFTYLEENRLLFPCDFFGSHTAYGLYDDSEELIPLAKKYFGEIMMPFREMGRRAMERLRELEIEMIAPSHGPIIRNPKRIMEAYRRWTSGETTGKALILYVSMWGSTEAMVKSMASALTSRGAEVNIYNIANSDLGEIAGELVDSRGIVLGTPTVLGGMHPMAAYAVSLIRALRPPVRYGAVLGSYNWGGGGVRQAVEALKAARVEVVGSLEVRGPPSPRDHEKIDELGGLLSKRIMEG